MGFPLLLQVVLFLLIEKCVQSEHKQHVARIVDPDLYYAAESRNYQEEPDTLFVTCRGGGLKVFNITSAVQFDAISQWITTAAVEGQDRIGDLLVVSELGRGPNGPFENSTGPKLHLFDLSNRPIIPDEMTPFSTIDLSPYIDGILHVKFVLPKERPTEVWAVCSAGFATTVVGGVVLVNLTSVVARGNEGLGKKRSVASSDVPKVEVSVLSTTVTQPEGVMVSPTDSQYVYIGGIDSTALGVIDISDFANPRVIETQDRVGMQLVGATRTDQPHWSVDDNSRYNDEQDLVYMAAWGALGGFVVLNASNAAFPFVQAQTPSTQALQLAMANRVKLRGDLALVPLEQQVGGFAVVNISTASSPVPVVTDAGTATAGSPAVNVVSVVHIPLAESRQGNDSLVTTKAYCLAVSGPRYIYLFIAETAAVYVYCLDDILKGSGYFSDSGDAMSGS